MSDPNQSSNTDAISEGRVTSLHINSASLEDWLSLPGMDAQSAQRIITFREEFGDFDGIDDLLWVASVECVRLEKWRPYLLPGYGPTRRSFVNRRFRPVSTTADDSVPFD